MKFSLAVLTIALFLPARPVSAQALNVQGLQAQLRQQYCSQQWADAASTADRLLAAPIQWNLGQREQMSDYRDLLTRYAQTGARFSTIPGCGDRISTEQWERAASTIGNGAGSGGRRTGGASHVSSPASSGSSIGSSAIDFDLPYRSGRSSVGSSSSGSSSASSDTNSFGGSNFLGRGGSSLSLPIQTSLPLSVELDGSTGGGSCNTPSDIATDRSRCSGRAASTRSSGR
jgi:hypothetical protein